MWICSTLSLSLYLPVSLPPFLPASLPVSLPPFYPTSLSLPLYFPSSLPPCYLAFLSPFLPLSIFLPPCYPASLPPYLPPCYPISLPTYLPTYLHPSLPPCLPASLPALSTQLTTSCVYNFNLLASLTHTHTHTHTRESIIPYMLTYTRLKDYTSHRFHYQLLFILYPLFFYLFQSLFLDLLKVYDRWLISCSIMKISHISSYLFFLHSISHA